MRRTDRRSPGIRFESRPPPLPDPLPRMDVTAFVGFAASGPLHVPVAVDDPRQFANVFGDDVALGWDGDAGQVVHGHLGPCVRAFFRNGGRRCWVVRVAGAARANRFAIPALARWRDGALVPACAVARCEGSWSDALAASAALAAQPIGLGRVELGAGGRLVSAQLLAPDQASVGDVLQIALGGPVVVAAIAGIDAGVARFGDGAPLWLTSAAPALPDPSALAIAWFPGPNGDGGDDPMAQPLVPAGPPRLDGDALVVPVVAPPDGSSDAGALAPGRLVRLRWAGEELWLSVEDVVDAVAAGAGSPPGAAVELRGGWSRRLPGAAPGPAVLDGGALVAERLRISLWVQRGTERPTRLDDLGLAPGQPSYLGALPTDRALFASDPRPPDGDGDGDGALGVLGDQLSRIAGNAAEPREYYAALWQQVATPRFPLAIAAAADAFVPIAMPVVPGAYLGAQLPDGSAAARDGLAAFGPELFLDPDLADQAVDGLLAQADHVRWQASAPRRLTGIHAVLGVDEVTLLAVPDAVQRGWASATAVPPPVLAPPVVSAARADGDTWQLSWTPILASGGGDPTYAVEADASADFTHPEVVWTGGATLARLTDQPAGTRWFRVHAMQGAALGPWSNALALAFPPPQFQDCPAGVSMAPPVLTALAPDARGSIALAWTDVPGAQRFTVEEVAGGDAVATVIYQGRDHEIAVRGRPPGAYAYRVRAERGQGGGQTAGAWSEPAEQVVPPPRPSLIVRAADFQPDAVLRPVHRAALRMAAARGDLLAVLALPAQFRAPDATAHVAWLREPAGEEPTWSYAALYHPWLVGDDDPGSGPVPTLPPDGAVCGMMAQRAARRGAWIAPANQPLRGAIELSPVVARDDVDRFADAGVNLLRDEPHGILALSATTLARDPDLTQIHVRRLLVLLRRIALRVGPGYVFEPSGAVFQRLVRRGFEAVLDDLFARGAFAGAERSAAYQLAVDASASVADQGRFVVEMKVAPSQPLSFLTVRLVQSGDLGVVTEAR